MILLEEIETKARLEKEKRESLPPYTPRRVSIPAPAPIDRQRSNTLQVPSTRHRPRYPSSHSHSSSSVTASTLSFSSYNTSTLSLVTPRSPATAASSSQVTLVPPRTVAAFAKLSDASERCKRPPSYVRAANLVHVDRIRADIGGTFVVDPSLAVPAWLLADVPDTDGRWRPAVDASVGSEPYVSRTRSSVDQQSSYTKTRGAKGKEREKRPNLCLVTESGDVCADVWVREGCATRVRQRTERTVLGTSYWEHDDEDEEKYWSNGWTSPPSSHPWPTKTEDSVDIDVHSDRGSVTLRIYAQVHQRLRVRVRSVYGNITIGLPRAFLGSVYTNADCPDLSGVAPSPPMSTPSSYPLTNPSSSGMYPMESDVGFGRRSSNSSGQGESALLPSSPPPTLASSLPIPLPRQSVQFSPKMEEFVTVAHESRRGARGRYFVGDKPTQHISEHMGEHRYFDELHVESRTGAITLFFNDEDEIPQPRGGTLISKILNKAF